MIAPLDGLHDFYQPAAPAWTPHTIGWYALFAIVGLFILWRMIRAVRRWFADRYRREALRELATTSPEGFSTLLKRVALAEWPRAQVASLSGDAWLNFLCSTGGNDAFHHAPGSYVEEVALRMTSLSSEDSQVLREITANWIRRHRVQA